MQRAVFPQATFTQIQTQASRVLPGHGTGMGDQAVNDDVYHDENSPLRLVFSVLANVVGGTLLLSGMFYLPHVIAKLLS
jgi:hypothetical protein